MNKNNFTQTKDIFIFSSQLAPITTKILLKTGLSANAISMLSFLLIIIFAPMIAFGNYWVTLIGALLLQLHIILDFSDGAIAKIKETTNQFGEYYCTFQHQFIPAILMIALSIKTYRVSDNPIFLLAGSFTILMMYITNYSRLIKDNIALDYCKRFNKTIKTTQELNIMIGDTKEGMKDGYMLCKTSKNYIVSNVLYFFNSFSHLMSIILLLAAFDVLPYGFIFYSAFYITIGIIKPAIEIKKGMEDYKLT